MAKNNTFMYNDIGDDMETKIQKLDDYGRGIAFVNEKITFLSNALENEFVEYQITKQKKKYQEAEVSKILEKNIHRVEVTCPYYLTCGGCHVLHMNISHENEFKKEKVKNILKKFAGIEIEKLEIFTGKEECYRNKITLTVQDGKLGLLATKSNQLVEISHCNLANKQINEVMKKIREFIKEEQKISKIMIRTGKTKEVMISITGKVEKVEKWKEICDSLIINNQPITKEYITSSILDKEFMIRNSSFFQVNDEVVELLYQEVLNIIKKIHSQNVLDLYCGVGTIGICIANEVKEVLGIEVVKEAVIDANENKKRNHIKNIAFKNGKVEDLIGTLPNIFDTVIVDPPRSGLDQRTKESIIKMSPQNIIYVSCDPVTLSRDLKDLNTHYELQEIKLFNMFPRTYHVESMCLLRKIRGE